MSEKVEKERVKRQKGNMKYRREIYRDNSFILYNNLLFYNL